MGYDNELQNEKEGWHGEQPSTAQPASEVGSVREEWYSWSANLSGTKSDRIIRARNVDGREKWVGQVRAEYADQICAEHNQHSTLVEQRDRLLRAAKFLLAMNATNYDRDVMRSEGGFDALQKAVDDIEQSSRHTATTIEQGAKGEEG